LAKVQNKKLREFMLHNDIATQSELAEIIKWHQSKVSRKLAKDMSEDEQEEFIALVKEALNE